MKAFLVLISVAYAAAAPGLGQLVGGYNAPLAPRPVYGQPEQQPIPDSGYGIGNTHNIGKIHRHVYVHVAPQDEEDNQRKIVRVPGTQDKHVNIIFVKAPSTNFAQNTEIELPPQDQHKTLVYVLLKKPQSADDLKIRGPAPTTPSKPEVFFIRYKDEQKNQAYGAPPPAAYGPPATAAPVQAPASGYGTPNLF